GEFMGENEDDPGDWDTAGLSSWAMSKFSVSLPQNQIRRMTAQELEDRLIDAAIEQIDKRECGAILKYLEPGFAERELAAWARDKFGIEVAPEELIADAERGLAKPVDQIVDLIEQRAREAYARREIEYPI